MVAPSEEEFQEDWQTCAILKQFLTLQFPCSSPPPVFQGKCLSAVAGPQPLAGSDCGFIKRCRQHPHIADPGGAHPAPPPVHLRRVVRAPPGVGWLIPMRLPFTPVTQLDFPRSLLRPCAQDRGSLRDETFVLCFTEDRLGGWRAGLRLAYLAAVVVDRRSLIATDAGWPVADVVNAAQSAVGADPEVREASSCFRSRLALSTALAQSTRRRATAASAPSVTLRRRHVQRTPSELECRHRSALSPLHVLQALLSAFRKICGRASSAAEKKSRSCSKSRA